MLVILFACVTRVYLNVTRKYIGGNRWYFKKVTGH